MYDRILAPLKGEDSDEAIVAHARALGRLTGGQVILLRVIHSHSRDENTLLEERASAYLAELTSRLAGEGVAATGEVAAGEPAPGIVATAERFQADLIVMATHGHHEVRHVLMGSVTEAVVRNSLAPVLLVRP